MANSVLRIAPVRLFLLLPLLLLGSSPVRASGELMVAPTRLVFEGRTRTAQVTLVNTGTERATYRISLVHKRMTENGGFQDIVTPRAGEQFVDRLIRFSPRQVTLGPGEGQVVRLLLRKPPHLHKGEYRSHMLFRSIPPVQRSIENQLDQPRDRMSIRLIPVLAISIPIIVRQGQTHASARLDALALRRSPNGPALGFTIGRSGDRSVFGDLTATFQPDSGSARVIGQANGVAVYTPLPRRHFSLPLRVPDGVSLHDGTVRLTYRARSEQGGGTLAEAELRLP